MSISPRKRNPIKRTLNTHASLKALHEDNNNSIKSMERLHARTFVLWYQRMVDYERHNFTLYLSDEVVLEWFGLTIRSRKKVSSFLKYHMECTKHDFSTMESVEKIITRTDKIARNSEFNMNPKLACPLSSEISNTKSLKIINRKRPGLRPRCKSPEWDKNCQYTEPEFEGTSIKKMKINDTGKVLNEKGDGVSDLPNLKGDGEIFDTHDRNAPPNLKRKCVLVTPPYRELGQGDCMPSTSSDSEMSHAALNAQLPKKAVECTGYVELTRTRNSRSVDSMKWERKCKLQISYSVDPLNVGEYIVWGIYYTGESKCRRNLLAEFEEVAVEEDFKKL